MLFSPFQNQIYQILLTFFLGHFKVLPVPEFQFREVDPFRVKYFLALTVNQNESDSKIRVLPNLEPTNMIRLMFRYLLTNSSTCLISVYSTNTINLKCYTTGMSRLNILYRGKKYEVSVSF